MKNLICKFLDHKWKYNFPIRTTPNKAICSRCKCKAEFDLRNLEWNEVLKFKNEKRSDKELINEWFYE